MVAKTVPSLSVVISTRNRGAAVVGCVRSLLRDPDPDFEVLVIDQSDDDSTGIALRAAFDDPRLSHRRSHGRGLAVGRNDGTRLSRSALVGMTDDDCEVDPGWIAEIRRAFENPHIGLLFGSVRPGPHDGSLGFIPACVVARLFVGARLRDKVHLDGMGACMAFRRDLWDSLNGFDEVLGAGARFHSGEETDFCLRALLAGRAVCVTPLVGVVHHGFRPSTEAQGLAHAYWYGTGAVFSKLLRCGHLAALGPLAGLGWRFLFDASPVAQSLNGATRSTRLRAFLGGAWAAARVPIDGARGLFRMA
jgi:GT2 family glycosyltransferase